MSSQYQSAPAPPPGSYGDGPSGPRSGFWRRFAAAFVDGLVLAIPNGGLYLIEPVLSNTIGTVIGIVYYITLEGGPRGQTVGKMALGIRVYDLKQGGPIGYGRATIRYFGRIVSTIPLFLGYFWMIWDKEKQTWQDKFAGSVVVPVDAYPR